MALALVYQDGFDDYTTLADEWVAVNGTPAISAGNGRNGASHRVTGSSNGSRRMFDTSYTGMHALFAERQSNGAPGNRCYLLTFVDSAGTKLGGVGYDSTMHLQIYRNDTVLATASGTITAGVHQHIEVEYIPNATTGRFKVYLDGNTTPVIDFTGNTGTGPIFGVLLNNVPNNFSTTNQDTDDLMIFDNGGSLNGQIGDHKVESLLPSGNGNSSQLVGSDTNSVDNYLLVDETDPDFTDYVESATVGDKDTYAFADLATASGTIKAVQVCLWAKKTDAGLKQMQPVVRHSGSDNNGTAQTLAVGGIMFNVPYDTNPGTSAAWTISDVNAAEFGVRVST